MENLKQLLEKNNMSQKQLALALKVSQPTVSDWIANRKAPSSKSTARLADYFGVTVDFILDRTNDPVPPGAKIPEQDDIDLDELEFALFGEVRELRDEEKEELIRMARRMRELEEFRKRQEGKE